MLLFAAPPDITRKHRTKVELKGTLGTMMKLFGGNKPIYQVEYLHGHLKRTDKVNKKGKIESSQIIDLEREIFINIDYKRKKYTEMTFEQWRQMLNSWLSGILRGDREDRPETDQPKPEVKLKFDVKVDQTGETKDFFGNIAEKVVLILKAEADVEATDKETGDKVKGRGGMILTSRMWIAKSLDGREEEMAFNKRLAEKLGMAPVKGGLAGLIETVMEKNPDLAAALKKLQEESEKLEGVVLRSESVVETWGESDRKMQQGQDEPAEAPKSVGGLLKGLGKKFGKKKKDKEKPNVLLETENEVTEYSRHGLTKELFAIPEKFKKEEVKLPEY
jgi:hypothetical protein